MEGVTVEKCFKHDIRRALILSNVNSESVPSVAGASASDMRRVLINLRKYGLKGNEIITLRDFGSADIEALLAKLNTEAMSNFEEHGKKTLWFVYVNRHGLMDKSFPLEQQLAIYST